MPSLIIGRGNTLIIPEELILFDDVMARVDAIAAEVDHAPEVPC
jgi:hypothetical protein